MTKDLGPSIAELVRHERAGASALRCDNGGSVLHLYG